jgi:hypothetical protein
MRRLDPDTETTSLSPGNTPTHLSTSDAMLTVEKAGFPPVFRVLHAPTVLLTLF